MSGNGHYSRQYTEVSSRSIANHVLKAISATKDNASFVLARRCLTLLNKVEKEEQSKNLQLLFQNMQVKVRWKKANTAIEYIYMKGI